MNRRRPRPFLRWLGLLLLGAQAIAAITLIAVVAPAVHRAAIDQQLASLESMAHLLADSLPLATDDPAELRGAIDRFAADGRIRVTIIALDGGVLADSAADPDHMPTHRLRPEIDEAIRNGRGSGERMSATLEQRLLYAAIRAERGHRPAVIVRASIPTAALDSRDAAITRLIAGVLGASMVFTFVAMWIASRHLSRARDELESTSRQLAQGRLDRRADVDRAGALGTIAVRMNEMASSLSGRLSEAQRMHEEQRAILESMTSGLIALDLEQRVLGMNTAALRLLGVAEAVERGRLLQEIVRHAGLNRFATRAIAASEPLADEFALNTDPRLVVAATSEPLTDVDDRATGVLILLTDVTKLKRLETLRSDFAANVSHELRTPITSIKGYVDTLLEIGVADEAQAMRFLEVVKRNTERLGAIIEDLLALARLEQPGAPETLERSNVSVDAIMRPVIDELAPAAAAKTIELVLRVDPALRVHVAPSLIEQALANLVSNAVKYSPPRTRVTLSAAERADHLVAISVVDQGPGIAPQHQDRIFERFYRIDQARSRELGGTGLGLAIVKHIALVHGGRVELESRPGAGSTFRLCVPAARE